MKQEFTRIAVKVGSNVLARRDGTLDVTRMSALVDQIAELNKSGVEIILRELLLRDAARYTRRKSSTV